MDFQKLIAAIAIELPESKKTLLVKALRKISKTGFIDDDMVSQTIERKDEFQFIHVESGIEIDFWVIGDDEFSLSKIKRRKAKIIEGKKNLLSCSGRPDFKQTFMI